MKTRKKRVLMIMLTCLLLGVAVGSSKQEEVNKAEGCFEIEVCGNIGKDTDELL